MGTSDGDGYGAGWYTYTWKLRGAWQAIGTQRGDGIFQGDERGNGNSYWDPQKVEQYLEIGSGSRDFE